MRPGLAIVSGAQDSPPELRIYARHVHDAVVVREKEGPPRVSGRVADLENLLVVARRVGRFVERHVREVRCRRADAWVDERLAGEPTI